jgi:lipid A 4'-phosphatase
MVERPEQPDRSAAPGSGAPAGGPARSWRRDLLVVCALAVATTVLFAVTPLDIAAARLFYRPSAVDHWPLSTVLPWSVLYGLAPWIAAALILVGLTTLAAGVIRRRDDWRRSAIFVLLSVVIGPGIIVNGVFKDHWDRPRPREVAEFGGAMHYVAAPLRGEGGASFPCGHCSVGYLCALGWWVWRRRRPVRAGVSLAAGLTMGTLLGVARMAAGGHFLSDVVWSALIPLGIAHALYHYVLRVPTHTAVAAGPVVAAPQSGWERAVLVLSALGGVAVLLALFAMPHGTGLATTIDLDSFPRRPEVLEVTARTANVEIALVDSRAKQISVAGELHGFGLPTSRLRAYTGFVAEPVPTLRYTIEQRGWFTDLSGSATITVPSGCVSRIVVRIRKGDITVVDATREGVVRRGTVQLDLRTGRGRVREIRPSGGP